MAQQLELMEGEEELVKYQLFRLGWKGGRFGFVITNQRIILIPFKLIGKKDQITVNYADIESAKSAFKFETLSGYACFTLLMKDGKKQSFGLPKTMKDELKQTLSVMKSAAANDEARKHDGFFGDSKKQQKWDDLRRKANQELAASGPGPRRDKIVALVNQALEAVK
jgi:hypothetical protein